MRFVCVSDTHSLHWRISDISGGDVLIHAGDCLGAGTLENVEDLNDWLGTLPHRHKIVIAGNHDWVFQEAPELASQSSNYKAALAQADYPRQGASDGRGPLSQERLALFCKFMLKTALGQMKHIGLENQELTALVKERSAELNIRVDLDKL